MTKTAMKPTRRLNPRPKKNDGLWSGICFIKKSIVESKVLYIARDENPYAT